MLEIEKIDSQKAHILDDIYEKNVKDSRLISIQALRAWAFLGIFLSHAGSAIKWPTLGVSVFYTLSGFLMYKKHSNDEIDLSYGDRAKFSWERISKLYQLHIITMCCAVVLALVVRIYDGFTVRDGVITFAEILLNITLTQTWIPYSNINVSLNGVAWFLSVTMFLYFMFPRICEWIKNKSNKLLLLICIGILFVEVLSCIPWILFLGNDSPIYIWFMYCFPVFRMGDFFIGCSLAKWYFTRNNKKIYNIVVSSIIEMIALTMTIAVFEFLKIKSSNIIMLALHNWTTIYIPIAAIWIIIFAENKGLITRILSNKISIFIGNISPYLFLIHYVVTQWTNAGMKYLRVEPIGVVKYIIITAEFLVSIILAVAYKWYKSRTMMRN